jgi:hypothetical protein
LDPLTTTRSNVITRASRFLGHFRWAFMPLGLFALVAVGVHAAADTLDDRLLWVVEQADSTVDGWLGRWEWTSSWVRWVEGPQRSFVARGLTLLYELAVDFALAVPMFGYR